MAWTEFVINTDGIKTVYDGEIPALDKVCLHEIRIGRDGPEIHVRCALAKFPANPPGKWKSVGYNCAQVELVASGVREFRISGNFGSSECSIKVEEVSKLVTLSSSSAHLDFYVISSFLRLDRISAYYDSYRL